MKPRLFQVWCAQNGRCFFCDGNTLLDGRTYAGEIRRGLFSPRDRKATPRARAMGATLATLARECDGGNRAWQNLVMACRFCFDARQHPFALDHRAEMQALIRYGAHPLHLGDDLAAAA